MIEGRKRVTGFYNESLASEGLAVWQIKTDSAGNLLSVAAIGRTGSDSTGNLLSADGRRGGNVLFRPVHGPIKPNYLDGRSAGVALRVSQPYPTQPERMLVEINP